MTKLDGKLGEPPMRIGVPHEEEQLDLMVLPAPADAAPSPDKTDDD